MNLVLAIVALVAMAVWVVFAMPSVGEPLSGNVFKFFFVGAMLNIVLMLFNLMPIPPLDGGRVATRYFPAYRQFVEGENGRWVALGAFIMLFWFAGRALFGAAEWVVSHGGRVLIDALRAIAG
jgi:Zn-dependent protease